MSPSLGGFACPGCIPWNRQRGYEDGSAYKDQTSAVSHPKIVQPPSMLNFARAYLFLWFLAKAMIEGNRYSVAERPSRVDNAFNM
jgi:hypothetical protein